MDDRELARQALDFQNRAVEVPYTQIPAFRAWSERKIAEGESEDLIDHIYAYAMVLRPEDVPNVSEDIFDEELEDLKERLGVDGD